MAKYQNLNGQTIETSGHNYSIYDADGSLIRSADVSKWSYSAAMWIENDIESGYYEGFFKVVA